MPWKCPKCGKWFCIEEITRGVALSYGGVWKIIYRCRKCGYEW